MNSALEIHDSTVARISNIGSSTILHFDKAYIHKSKGVAGTDRGTGWLQAIDLEFTDSNPEQLPTSLPVVMSDGQLIVNGKLSNNVFDLPLDESGEVAFIGITSENERVSISAKRIKVIEVGVAEYLEG